MAFEYLNVKSLIILRTKRAFEVKWKIFFLVLQVLSFRIEKQSSKNVADKTFKQSFGLAGENEKMSHDVHLAVVIVKYKE